MAGTEARTQEQIDTELSNIDTQLQGGAGSGGDGSDSAATAAAEVEAGGKGWVPKDQYRGDPTKWKDAATFLADGRKYNSSLQREVDMLRKRLDDDEVTKKQFVKFHEELLARKNDELKEAISALRIQRSAATRDGDDELAIQLEDRIELLRDQQKEVKQQPTAAAAAGPELLAPVLREWIDDDNQWFDNDAALRAYAVALGDQMRKDGNTTQGRKFLDSVRAKMEEEFPRKFANKSAARLNAVESGSTSTSGGSAHSIRDLPEADLKLMRSFIKSGLTTQEKFLKNYFDTSEVVGRRSHR